jgi:hypothetical protein
MIDVNGSSERASRISRVVGEIVFQTNVLALNAALEAASAGESGRRVPAPADADTAILVPVLRRGSSCDSGPYRAGLGGPAGSTHDSESDD